MQVHAAPNPLFLRDEALDSSLELLALVQLDMADAIRPALERAELRESDFTLLFLIHRHPGMSMTELGRIGGMSKQSLSRHVATLVERGLVAATVDRRDRRRRLLSPTEEAMPLINELATTQRRCLRRAFGRVGGQAVEGFRRVLADVASEQAKRLRPDEASP